MTKNEIIKMIADTLADSANIPNDFDKTESYERTDAFIPVNEYHIKEAKLVYNMLKYNKVINE